MAAKAAAPAPSTMMACDRTKCPIDVISACSLTNNISSTRCCIISNAIGTGPVVAMPPANEVVGRYTICFCRIDSVTPGAASDCTPMMCGGAASFWAATPAAAMAHPAIKLPPPTGISIAWVRGRSCIISSPTVPAPAIIQGSSPSSRYNSPSRAAISRAIRQLSPQSVPSITTRAPAFSILFSLISGVPTGTTTVQTPFTRPAAHAIAAP